LCGVPEFAIFALRNNRVHMTVEYAGKTLAAGLAEGLSAMTLQ